MAYEYAQGLSSALISREEAKRLRKLEKEAKELDKTPAPEYELSPAITKAYEEAQGIYAKGQQRAKYGYSPEEQAAFANALARNQNVQMQRGQQAAGGQASRYIGSALAANNLQATSDFLARDAAFKQQKQNYADSLFGNVSGMARTLQSQQNQIQQNRIRRRELLENALGRGMSQARMNMYGAMYKTAGSMDASYNQAQEDVMNVAMMKYKGGSTTKNTNTNEPSRYKQPSYKQSRYYAPSEYQNYDANYQVNADTYGDISFLESDLNYPYQEH